jgi:hypothetical protein
MSGPVGEQLGRHLLVAGFRPLPDADDDGVLIGTRLWRVTAGYVEYLAVRRNGLAHAVRAVARFDYRQPADHGPVVEHRFGAASNALDWLLAGVEEPLPSLRRPYAPPAAPSPWTDPNDGADDWR